MAKILTHTTGAFEHYLYMKYDGSDFPRAASLNITGATTLTSTIPSSLPTTGAGKKLFACVSSVTDLTADMTVTLTVGATVYSTIIKAYAPIDSIWVIKNNSGGSTDVATLAAGTYTVTGGTAGAVIEIIVVDDANWLELGTNWNEGVSFDRGPMSVSIARGWTLTDHQKRIRQSNGWSIRQLYCSQTEGIANLRGKTILIKDEIRPDGNATVKETWFISGAQVANVGRSIGGGGTEAAVDSVDAGGAFRRAYIWTQDTTSITATS